MAAVVAVSCCCCCCCCFWCSVRFLVAVLGLWRVNPNCDQVIVLWTANTERFCEVTPGVHDTEANLMKAIVDGHAEVSPSQIFAIAALQVCSSMFALLDLLGSVCTASLLLRYYGCLLFLFSP